MTESRLRLPTPEVVGRRFSSRLHEPRTAAILGATLGVSFTLCFLTGLLSHLWQHPLSWFPLPTRPAGWFRINQGIHVISGTVSIPLLLAKLWVVFPKLFEWPPFRSATHAVERLALLPLVGGSLFMLMSGTANVARWYPYPFYFPAAHYAGAWITVGGLIIHVGAKWATTRLELGPRARADRRAAALADPSLRADRRRFLAGASGIAGLMFLATAGNTIRPLSRLSALAQRRPGVGPQGLPVNKSAADARVPRASFDYRLLITRRGRPDVALSLDDLRAMGQREAELPIACVEGWSTSARWRGVPVAELVALVGGGPITSVRVQSMQPRGGYRKSDLIAEHIEDRDTMLALEVNGEELHIDHGYPARLIGPGRPGVLQTKWVYRLEVR